MKLSVYLPDDIAAKAKAAGLSLSPLLREVVIDELQKIDATNRAESEMTEITLSVSDEDGDYNARFTGSCVAENNKGRAYLLADGCVYWHDDDGELENLVHPEEDLKGYLGEGSDYLDAMRAMGITPTINL